MLMQGKQLLVKGQFRSYNSYDNEKNRLILTVFAKDVVEVEENNEEEENEMTKKDTVTNEVVLVGYICKKPIYRQTPFGREIADVLLAVNRAYNKSDYIPTIAWGRNARFCQNLEVGTKVKLVGRVQSRMYEKKHEDGTVENRVAYEVSIGSLEIVDEDDTENKVESNQEAV
jgi:single-stranded DNA-binding protein